ncbi:hypothetical protein [Methanobrevibacter sp.]
MEKKIKISKRMLKELLKIGLIIALFVIPIILAVEFGHAFMNIHKFIGFFF